jgi:hypothetical protein
MLLVLRKTSIKRTLSLSILLIIAGFALANPLQVRASNPQIIYLYPYQTNNPVQPNGLFWWETHPELGAYNKPTWDKLLGNQVKVLGIPQGYVVSANMLGNNLGNWVVWKLKNRIKDKMATQQPQQVVVPSPPPENNEPFVYKRKVGNSTEEIKIPKKIIDEHFGNNKNFDKFMDTVKKHLTDNELIRDVSAPKGESPKQPPIELPMPEQSTDDAQKLHIAGNALMVGGVALMLLKLLPLLAL